MLHRSAHLCLSLSAAALPAQFIPDVVSYYDATATTHQSQFTTLAGQGYRPISLSVAGGLSNPRYTAVWIRRSGAGFTAVHGVDAAAYDTWRAQQRNAGRRPLLVSTSGSATDTVYTGVYVNDGVTAVEEIELYLSGVNAKNTWAYDNNHLLTCMSVRGGAAPRFAGIWEDNVDRDGWCFYRSPAANYAADFNARVDGYGRLVSAQSSYDGVVQVWRDDSVGGWLTLPDLTLAQLQSEVSTRRPTGQYPISIQATSTGSAARFHVVFANRDRAPARTLTRTGTAVTTLDAFDNYMEDHIRTHGIRASSIAIAKDGRLVYARGYTFAEPGYPTTQPTDLFRIASVTKPLTGLCINLLDQRNIISPNTLVAAYVGLTPAYVGFNSIRVHHLLAHRAGLYADNSSYGVAQWLNPNNPTLPIGAWHTTLCIAATPLAYTTGQGNDYSNLGYYLLGSVIEQGSNKTYENFLRDDVAAPMGVSRIWVGANERIYLRAEEVEYRNRELEITPSQLYTDRRTVSVQFGGGGDDNLRRRAAAGGIITSTVDCVRIFAGAMDLGRDGGLFTQTTVDAMRAAPVTSPGANPCGFDSREVRPNGVIALGKNGKLWGSSTELIHRTDGVTIAVFDGRQNSNASRNTLNAIADAITTWPTHDLFPNYGLPAFIRVWPRIYDVQNSSVPTVSDEVVVVTGDVLSGVDRVSYSGPVGGSFTARVSSSWADGYFEIPSNNRLELHMPQGLRVGTYQVILHNGLFASTPFNVTLTRPTTTILGGPPYSFSDFEMVAARGQWSINSVMLLCISNSTRPSVAPGIVSLGLGNAFSELILWPTTVPVSLVTGCARWTVPGSVAGLWQLQAAILDPTLPNPLPLPVTNVRAVRAL